MMVVEVMVLVDVVLIENRNSKNSNGGNSGSINARNNTRNNSNIIVMIAVVLSYVTLPRMTSGRK